MITLHLIKDESNYVLTVNNNVWQITHLIKDGINTSQQLIIIYNALSNKVCKQIQVST